MNKLFKHIKLLSLAVVIAFAGSSCKKEILDLKNPNDPGIESLETEEGIKRAALGIYEKFGLEYWWLALTHHEIMGDSYFASAGNFSWRWANQPTKIILSNGTILTPPQGADQATELRNRNERSFGDDNAFKHEWLAMYYVNNQANLLLDAASSPALSFSGNGDVKKKTIQAWAHWWKGFAYSRLGSIYISGIITDKTNETNANFVTNQQLIAEANKQFDAAAALLSSIPDEDDYEDIMTSIVPDFTQVGKGQIPTPEMWIRHINTYKARNLLVNKPVADMTTADWTAIKALATNGLRSTDNIFTMRSANVNDLVFITAWAPARALLAGWLYISERLVQDFKPGDARYTRNIIPYPPSPIVNRSGRGYQYGTRWSLKAIENGGDYVSTQAGLAEIPVGASYEENELMLAEANIKLGLIPIGLQHIDNVRTYQNAQLSPIASLALTPAAAYEELRKERRIGLLNKNVSFYDARRWGVVKPLAQGGGRSNAIVILTGGVADNATIDYNYLSYWDVPKNELDFNTPSSATVPVTGY